VKALGSRHSFSTVADTTGVLVDVVGLPHRLEVDRGNRTATVSAALRYAEVALTLGRGGAGAEVVAEGEPVEPRLPAGVRGRPAGVDLLPPAEGAAEDMLTEQAGTTGRWPERLRSRPRCWSPRSARSRRTPCGSAARTAVTRSGSTSPATRTSTRCTRCCPPSRSDWPTWAPGRTGARSTRTRSRTRSPATRGAEFAALADKADPLRVFRNGYLDRLLGS
jgi:hypothetical protein